MGLAQSRHVKSTGHLVAQLRDKTCPSEEVAEEPLEADQGREGSKAGLQPNKGPNDLLTEGSVLGLIPLDVPEEVPLGRVQRAPFFSGKIERDVSQCHRLLEQGEMTQLRSPRQLCVSGDRRGQII